jgi:uncharacterized protein
VPEDLEIVISEDGLQAVVQEITPQTSVEDVLAALKQAGVTEGVSGEGIQNAVSQSQKSNRPLGEVVVAKGTAAKPAVPPHIEPPEGAPALAPLSAVVKLLQSETATEVTEGASKLKARTVLPGDTLGTVIVAEGEPGKSVTGKEIVAESASSGKPPTEPGPGATKSDSTFTASVYGYAGIVDGQAAVLTPFWISQDGMVAGFVSVQLEDGRQTPDAAQLEESAKAAGITWGIDTDGLQKLADALARDTKLKPLLPVARGELPTEPEDATPEISFSYISQSGLVKEDGSIDLRERNSFPGVAEGESLAQGKAGVAGKEGHTVKGEAIEVRSPVEAELVAGENVKLEGTAPNQKLVSEMDGGASCSTSEITADGVQKVQYTVAVRPVAQVSGNVDYDTGNLDFKGNVEIKGSVLSPFVVKATGDIRIGETVESGAQVYGEANLVVNLGIVGESTVVKTEGNITAKFIQDATVSAGGDIAVGSYIRSANVSSQGSITVEGSGGSVGGILGGEVWASDSITSKNVGSEHTSTTAISLGFDRESFEAFKEATRLAARAQDLRNSLLKSIGIAKLDSDEIKKCIRSQPRRKNEILRYVQKANDLAKMEEEHLKTVKDVGDKMKRASSSAHLDVPDTAYPKVTVRIGNAEKTLDAALKGVQFRLDTKKGVVASELSGDGDKGEA